MERFYSNTSSNANNLFSGAWLVDNERKQMPVKLPVDSNPGERTGGSAEKSEVEDKDFLTESYSVDDLFPSF